jgi:predicted ATP-dependent endonuclease of OLD family
MVSYFMRLTSIQLHGYRRFLTKQTLMVENKLIALVGPNEAGKSSVLDSLFWLNPDSPALTSDIFSRQTKPDQNQRIIEAKFRLTDDDLKALLDLGANLSDSEKSLFNSAKILRVYRTPSSTKRQFELDTLPVIDPEMQQEIARIFDARVPLFLNLHADERKLKPQYSFQNPPSKPNVIHNLLSIGGIEFNDVRNDFYTVSADLARSKLVKAERIITEIFKKWWTVSNLEIRLRIEGEEIFLNIINSSNHDFTGISERSEGFRWFLCLIAALEGVREYSDRPVVLLIDEAESHLHYEAQARLAHFLSTQTLAQHVIYTTHSPGCLPNDLSAIRAIIPNADNTSSHIESRVWSGAGKDFKRFFWLLGAENFAFTAARNVLITEGEADFLLLPHLFREALGIDELNFQVLPGLANAKKKNSFELEAVTVAYLVDGDKDGDKYKKNLLDDGVAETRIFQFESGLALEDYLNLQLYAKAVNIELEFARSGLKIDPNELDKPNRSTIVSNFAKSQGIEVSKRCIAERFLELCDELESQELLIDPDRDLFTIAKSLMELFKK